ncbi:putative DNA modification/repair radical SAM protein [Candidatus Solincola tengchongensis]|uniref:putative DNA modification/repair radical SAM protein n=1 Tax=Candidatus Solincola tengchongensis TaxID=2900693 RepID=UPI00257D8DCB|nr:putative DNA modification/repair radical SAM protein [Candidatus Solincola tengchongensis]
MDLEEKLRILGAAARFDVTCSTRNSRMLEEAAGKGGFSFPGIYRTWSEDGKCLPVLKILLSNRCVYDCAYCVNRASAHRPRASFTPSEVAEVTMEYCRRGLVRGLFLSSAVWVSPDHTMEKLVLAARELRLGRGFRGYIHLKVIPGASPELVREAAIYADRLSVNIELPTEISLRRLAPDKRREDILSPMGEIRRQEEAHRESGVPRGPRHGFAFLRAGQTTQLIIGATPENDLEILRLAEGLYRDYGLRRVYYSAFFPVSEDPRLPALREPPLLREHRLYQADWLIRRYGFRVEELLGGERPHLEKELDPKSAWALRNPAFFPVEVNRAGYEELIRVPGIGPRSARRIISARRLHSLDLHSLSRLGVVVSRARWFITCNGRYFLKRDPEPDGLRRELESGGHGGERGEATGQTALFDAGEYASASGTWGGSLSGEATGPRKEGLTASEYLRSVAGGEF